MRLAIDKLSKPTKDFRIKHGYLDDGRWVNFESPAEARSEDSDRSKTISQLIGKDSNITHNWSRVHINGLLRRIAAGATLASAVCIRRHRKRLGGHLLELMSRDMEAVHSFTFWPANWVFAAGSLDQVDARKLLANLRQSLRLQGASRASGWFFGFIDGEYEPNKAVFRLHVNGFAAGDMVEVVKNMRTVRNLRPVGKMHHPTAAKKPRRLIDVLDTPMRWVTKVIPGQWCERTIFEPDEGAMELLRERRRISSTDAFMEQLLWLDQWRLDDLALLIGMSVGSAGFNVRDDGTSTLGHSCQLAPKLAP